MSSRSSRRLGDAVVTRIAVVDGRRSHSEEGQSGEEGGGKMHSARECVLLGGYEVRLGKRL